MNLDWVYAGAQRLGQAVGYSVESGAIIARENGHHLFE